MAYNPSSFYAACMATLNETFLADLDQLDVVDHADFDGPINPNDDDNDFSMLHPSHQRYTDILQKVEEACSDNHVSDSEYQLIAECNALLRLRMKLLLYTILFATTIASNSPRSCC